MKKIIRIIVIVMLAASFTACEQLAQIANQAAQVLNLKNCNFDVSGVDNINMLGMNLSKGMDKSNLNATQLLKVTNSLLNKKLPVTFNVNIDVDNPNGIAATLGKMDYIISYGRFEGGVSKTPLLDDVIHTHRRWLDSEGAYGGYWSAPYATRWSPTAWFHSFTHYWKHSPRVIDSRLGMAVSGGCIRMQDQYSKWIYEHHKQIKRASVTVWNGGKYHW